jgi:hypothetical protein
MHGGRARFIHQTPKHLPQYFGVFGWLPDKKRIPCRKLIGSKKMLLLFVLCSKKEEEVFIKFSAGRLFPIFSFPGTLFLFEKSMHHFIVGVVRCGPVTAISPVQYICSPPQRQQKIGYCVVSHTKRRSDNNNQKNMAGTEAYQCQGSYPVPMKKKKH